MLCAACAINLCFHTAVLFISGVPMVTKFMRLVWAFLQTVHLEVRSGETVVEEEDRLIQSLFIQLYLNTHRKITQLFKQTLLYFLDCAAAKPKRKAVRHYYVSAEKNVIFKTAVNQ